jgi:hypothetical protein
MMSSRHRPGGRSSGSAADQIRTCNQRQEVPTTLRARADGMINSVAPSPMVLPRSRYSSSWRSTACRGWRHQALRHHLRCSATGPQLFPRKPAAAVRGYPSRVRGLIIRPATARNSSAAEKRLVLERAAVGAVGAWSEKYPAPLITPPFEPIRVWQSQCGVCGQSKCGQGENSNYRSSAAHDCLLCVAKQSGKGPIARRRMSWS